MGVQVPLAAIARLLTGHIHLAEVTAMHQLKFDGRRSKYAAGYMEFIWPTNLAAPASESGEPQALAVVCDRHPSDRPLPDIKYSGTFGRHVVWGRTVAECKHSLFTVIQNHFNEYGTVYGLA